MPLYATPQAGGVLTSVVPGDSYTLLNGTETVATGSKSIAFSRGYSPGADDAGSTFNVSGCKNGTTIEIEFAGQDVDSLYAVSNTLAPDANGNSGYTDVGRSPCWRSVVLSFVSGDKPVVSVHR